MSETNSNEWLDSEITGAGYQPPARKPRPHIPDYKALEDHAHYGQYFDRGRPFLPFPSWIYHANGESKVVNTAKEAKEHGVIYDKEEQRYICSGEWTTKAPKTKSSAQGVGKNVIVRNASEPTAAEVIAAFMRDQQARGQQPSPAVADLAKDPDYAEFLAFKAFKDKQHQEDAAANGEGSNALNAGNGVKPDASQTAFEDMTPEEKKEALLKVAEESNIKVDKRWGLERIEEELKKQGDPDKDGPDKKAA